MQKEKQNYIFFFATEECELLTRANILHLQQTEKVRNNLTDIQRVSFFSYYVKFGFAHYVIIWPL